MRLCVLLTAFVWAAPAIADEHPSVPLGVKSEGGEEHDDPPSGEPLPSGTLNVNPTAPPLTNVKYQGVVPGSDRLPPRAPRPPIKNGPQRLVWTGFQVRDGVPTLFFELTGSVGYRVEDQGNATIIHLDGAAAWTRNNLRPLRANFFEQEITDVDLKQGKKTIDIRIRGRKKAPLVHRERWENAAGGYQMLLVEFPRQNP